MQENNFKCECGKEFYISEYSSLFENGELINVDKYRQRLKCECDKALKSIPRKFEGFPMIGISSNDLSDVLKQRSKTHFNKEIKDVKREMDKKDKV